ncbi:uncharacterized protein LOC121265896 [Juglans microcarpa x Juglans regia]|uniref:uncharacterized protein LOC121265896 n=1 Tax=Juglans microcarpa x Juglans regia TaxID=2249226 RepID=UPI001B7E8662|nr:uncharacterized protein LOC121265896 [Juglans microcarpa x Juglans regia]
MEDELEKLWAGFSLTDREKQEVVMPTLDIHESMKKGRLCLLAQVTANKVVNREAFKSTMSKVWKPEGWIRFKEIGENQVLLEFQKEQDKGIVIAGRPWSFDRMLACLEEFDGCTPLKEIPFAFEVFWVQVHDLSLACMTKDVGVQIGERIGTMLDVEVDGSGVGWGQFLDIKVVVDITKTLIRGKFISFQQRQLWHPLKYECLPMLCFHCGIIKHAKRSCQKDDQATRLSEGSQPQYGAWLRTNLSKNVGSFSRTYGGVPDQPPQDNWQRWRSGEEILKVSGRDITNSQQHSNERESSKFQANDVGLGKIANSEGSIFQKREEIVVDKVEPKKEAPYLEEIMDNLGKISKSE